MNTLFHGYYGFKNTGDDAFVEVAAWGAKNFWSSSTITFLADNLPVIQNDANYLMKSRYKFQNLLKIYSSIFSSDSFICAGGSTFHSRIAKFNPKKIALLKKKIYPKFTLGAIGVSLGPYKSVAAENENIELLKHFDFLSLRDITSYKIAVSYNLPYRPIEAFDLAALLPEVYKDFTLNRNSINNKILGISVCNYERYVKNGDIKKEESRNKRIERLLKEIAYRNKEIIFRFFVFNGNSIVGDNLLTHTFASLIRSINPNNVEIVEYDQTTFNTWKKISECNLVFATRLHAAIFSCFANVPFFLIEYHRKCSDFLESIGHNDNYRIYDRDFDTKDLANHIIEIINNVNLYVTPKKLQEAKEKSMLNFTVPFF